MKFVRWVLAGGLACLLALAVGAAAFFAFKYKAPQNELVLAHGEVEFDFLWAATNMGGVVEPHSAILAPVRFAGLSKTFYMQFDLGAQSSVFYRGALEAIAVKLARNSAIHLDPEKRAVTGLTLALGERTVTFKKAEIRDVKLARQIDWDGEGAILIGTIGSDLLDGRVMMIDYPKRHVRILPAVPAQIASLPYGKFDYDERRILLHGQFEGRPTRIWFDTGSSAFALLTDAATWKRLAKNPASSRRFAVNSWGDMMQMVVADTDATITFAGVQMPLRQITAVEGATLVQSLIGRATGMHGMTGNKLFIDKQVILDAPHGRYWVVVGAGGASALPHTP